MAIEYFPTFEDQELTKSLRRVGGKLIDTRWAGGWLTPTGAYHPVNYSRGITHETIADEHGNRIWGSGSINSRPNLFKIYDLEQWMRIVYLTGSTFCVQLKGFFSYGDDEESERPKWKIGRQQQVQLLRFAKDFRDFDSYFINETKYDSYFSFANAIREGVIAPCGTSLVQRLRERLNATGMKPRDLATLIDVSPSTIRDIIDGKCSMHPEAIDIIEKYFAQNEPSGE